MKTLVIPINLATKEVTKVVMRAFLCHTNFTH